MYTLIFRIVVIAAIAAGSFFSCQKADGAGTPEERAEVERLRSNFRQNRFRIKQSADLLMRIQVSNLVRRRFFFNVF